MEEEYRAHFSGVLEEIPEEDLVPVSWQSSMHMADKIEHYIQDNFQDINLSLTQLADHFDLTKQYMCWLFKKEKTRRSTSASSVQGLNGPKNICAGIPL